MSLIVVIPLAMWMARYEISRFWRLAGAGSVAALSIATVLTESRGALVALGVLAVAELIRVRKKPGALIVMLAAFGTLIAFRPLKCIAALSQYQSFGSGDQRR